MNLTQIPQSDPAVLLRFRDRQYAADLMGAAVLRFDLFSLLDQRGGLTIDELCGHFQWQRRPADVLLTLCRASGVIETAEDGKHILTSTGREHLVRSSPWFLGPYYKPIADSPILDDYVSILRTGKPANWQAKSDGADWHESMKDPTFASDFTALMNCRGITFGQHLAASLADSMRDRKHLLDVGGGSGIYCTTMVAAHPHLTATVLEQSPVDEIAKQEIERHGMSDHVTVQSGDMFTGDWEEQVNQPIDAILFSNLLHDWDVTEAKDLVRRAAETLSPGGLLIIHGAIINEAKDGPLPVAEYSALLMNITQGKCYSVGEYNEMLTQHGFEMQQHQNTVGDRGFVTAILR